MPGILVGIDGSGHSRRALEWAVNEAALRQTPLTVLTVQQALAVYWGSPVFYPGDRERTEHAREMAREETDAALDELGPQAEPPEVTVLAIVGIPAEEILGLASNADMIVFGSRAAGRFKKRLMGSVSTKVTRYAHCPVVVIPPAKRDHGPRSSTAAICRT